MLACEAQSAVMRHEQPDVLLIGNGPVPVNPTLPGPAQRTWGSNSGRGEVWVAWRACSRAS